MYFAQGISLFCRTTSDAGHRVSPYHPPHTGAQKERRLSYVHAAVIQAVEIETVLHNNSGTQTNEINLEVELLCKVTRLGERDTDMFSKIISCINNYRNFDICEVCHLE